MNIFRHVRDNLLNHNSQGIHGTLYLLLSVLADQDDQDPQPVTGNPYAEVLDRLSKYDCDGVKLLERLMGTRVN